MQPGGTGRAAGSVHGGGADHVAAAAPLDLRICGACGERNAPSLAGEVPPRLRCPVCGAARAFVASTLFCLTGASGTGKSTVAAAVASALADRVVTLEQDVLWSPELADLPDGMAGFRARWLRLAAMIAQHGRPILLCGTVVPAELEPLPERCLFREIRYLALTAPPAVLRSRLRARPAWRGWDEARIAEMLEFAERLEGEGSSQTPPLTLVDTSHRSVDEVAAIVRAWVHAGLA